MACQEMKSQLYIRGVIGGFGFLWFGTIAGLTRYRPNRTKPVARIVSVKTDKGEYTELSGLPSIVTGSRVTIKYSSIDFKTVPEKRQYQYRIKEIDDKWGLF